MAETCTWCGDEVAGEDYVEVRLRAYNASADAHTVTNDVRARFHVSPFPCFSEARDHGWSA